MQTREWVLSLCYTVNVPKGSKGTKISWCIVTGFVSSSVHGFTTTSLNVSEGDPLQRIEVSLYIKGNTTREPAPATESFGLQVRCIDSGGPQTVSES